MKLVRLRLSNFRSFGPVATEVDLENMTFLLGPNGAGKTTVLLALARMFGIDPAQRKIRRSDFHISSKEAHDAIAGERTLWIEADFEFPGLVGGDDKAVDPAVPINFAHMQLQAEGGPAQVRYRLAATLDENNEIDESFSYVVKIDQDGNPVEQSRVAKQDRNAVQVHYLPARRDPADHISYSTNALLGRALRSADWSGERVQIKALTGQISDALKGNAGIESITDVLAGQWASLHKGAYYANPSVSFARDEIENLLRHLSVGFTPGHIESLVDFSMLSDGQQSLLYISLVLAMHELGCKVLNGELDHAFDIDKLRPAVFTLIAIEEPENSLSPHYLGRVIRAVTNFGTGASSQAVVATHAPSLLRRGEPESIRYLRLNAERKTVVKHIELPTDESAQKFIRQGVQAFPELYFSSLVVLGEGDSEEIVLPRLLAATGILADDASISVVPLGGRHVNHMWRLLNGLGIPHVTLLDMDVARYQGGWGRVKYAAGQLLKYADILQSGIAQENVDSIASWNGEPTIIAGGEKWIQWLEKHGVFFSGPLDLDFMMMTTYPGAYGVTPDKLAFPDEAAIKSVLGKSHGTVAGQYTVEQQSYFDMYHTLFKLGSKPTAHIDAVATLDDEALAAKMPPVLARMFKLIEEKLKGLSE